jgi:large subunit ribosomal protein L14
MIQTQTIIKVADNSGAKSVKCIKILGGFKKKYAKIGDIIVVSIQHLRDNIKKDLKVKKKDVYKAIVIRTKIGYKKINGIKNLFMENAVILINKQENPIGTRIIGPLPKIIRSKKFQKIISLSNMLI